jgi:L-serine dehydratase
VFDLMKIGLGPSSSHTVGPMKAAGMFVDVLVAEGFVADVARIEVDLFGSLAATGMGHGTLDAILLGLEGHRPDEIEPDEVTRRLARMKETGTILLALRTSLPFSADDIILHPLTFLPRHPNALRIGAWDKRGRELRAETFYSVGGGFVERQYEAAGPAVDHGPHPFPFETASQLLQHCGESGLSISEVMLQNELVDRPREEIRSGLLELYRVMRQSTTSSVTRSGLLPGGLGVSRRAAAWKERLEREDVDGSDPNYWQEWVTMIALAVNEENASGGRIVTAPTNGAAGVIPAVLYYATHYVPGATTTGTESIDSRIERFLLTAGAVGLLYKARASISGAEMGCQGEIGSACSMAAAGLAEVMGGTPAQVENAAEIAMEHNLGLTCDPVGGLVQIPCIERNAIGATKAISAAKMALWGDGTHKVSLDQVIETMRQTGLDMGSKYKETSTGGLADNVVDC